ncbi:MAG: hypothetical protein HQL46_12040 [Gammaproteobacteria bacterium]|nr:hypothetical protein [Gammaproteobacteria bacterium]
MTTKLIQKSLLKGTQEYEIVDDAVNVRIKKPFKEESYSVVLSILDPEYVVTNSKLEFHSRVKCSALLSFDLNKPSEHEFNAFIALLKQRAEQEYDTFIGVKPSTDASLLNGNVSEEPPEFEDSEEMHLKNMAENYNSEMINESISMLEMHVDSEATAPLISALKSFNDDPWSSSNQQQVFKTFHQLGANQGAVLTYAPYLITLMSNNPFQDKK